MLFPFLVSLLFVVLFYLLLKNTGKNLGPPGPPGLPLIGNLHQLATPKTLHIYLWQLSKKYGPIIHMKLGSKPLLVISSAKLAKQVLQTQDSAFCSRPKHLGLQKLSYNHSDIIFSPYNDYWREVRKIAVINLFNPKKTHSFGPIRKDEIARMVTKILGFASSRQVVDLSEIAMALSSALICRIAFSRRYDDHGSEMRKFDELLHAVQAVAVGFYASDYFPWLGYWVDKFTGMINRLDTTVEKMDMFYQELIDQHLSRDKKVEEEGDDILDILIKLKENKSYSIDLTWDNIKALLLDIFVAATDTSSSAIVWTMTGLVKAPRQVMDKAQAEIRNVTGKKGKVDEDDLTKLPYLKAVVSEALRLYPPGPLLIPRETIHKCTLEGYEIEANTVVYVNAWAIARDPEYWERPEEFLPERFLNGDIDIKGQSFDVIPFGSGRRICPGLLMGLANVELAVANLLCCFDWELPPGIEAKDVDTDALPGLAVHKKNPLLLVPTKCVA